ncbi:IS30 family transposase [Lysinibacillus sp. FJAT-14745]|uniref:IS30 family transposase n=1 Tax=Lysinibacillus sp. FJAT-14745 TaxID=1704289 RepID=UPI000AAABE11|nr:IS30 family transposase [Lysinibacillus sp. FJAT-14745]
MPEQHNIKTPNKKPRLTQFQRGELQGYLNAGITNKSELARKLKVSRGTIYNELARGTTTQVKKINGKHIYMTQYLAETGQAVTDRNVARSRKPLKFERVKAFLVFVDGLLLDRTKTMSLDAIVGLAKLRGLFSPEEMVSTKTLYHYIELGLLKTRNSDLLLKVRRNTKRTKKTHRPNKTVLGKSIEERPDSVESREEFGHFEIDSVVGHKDKEDDVLLTLIERKTRREFIVKMDGKDADSVNYALSSVLKEFGEYASTVFKSITADNGSEFAGLSEMFGDRIDIYFTHPYSSWERGTNENHNGIIRRFIPKGHAIEDYSRTQIHMVEEAMNNQEKCLTTRHQMNCLKRNSRNWSLKDCGDTPHPLSLPRNRKVSCSSVSCKS